MSLPWIILHNRSVYHECEHNFLRLQDLEYISSHVMYKLQHRKKKVKSEGFTYFAIQQGLHKKGTATYEDCDDHHLGFGIVRY